MHIRIAFLIFFTLGAILACELPVHAGEAGESSLGYNPEFKFMELRQSLREHPTGAEALPNHFSIGEYYFSQKMLKLAAESFDRLRTAEPKRSEELLANIYLLLCARSMGDKKNTALIESELQESFSSRQFISIFRAAKDRGWTSPLGNRYVFHEEVDRLEIKLNDKPFYTIDLS